jgi:hypothetical protein
MRNFLDRGLMQFVIKKHIPALLLAAALNFTLAEPALAAGNLCDRTLPRTSTSVPDLTSGDWSLKDGGTFQFRYSFYTRLGALEVTAMVTTGTRPEGLHIEKLTWQDGNEIFTMRTGPEAGAEPICVRTVVGGLTLNHLYTQLAPRLQR